MSEKELQNAKEKLEEAKAAYAEAEAKLAAERDALKEKAENVGEDLSETLSRLQKEAEAKFDEMKQFFGNYWDELKTNLSLIHI